MVKPIVSCITVVAAVLSIACMQQQKMVSPPGYDLNTPVKYDMPNNLHEISGIAFNKGNPNIFYAEQDEEGKVYYGAFGNNNIKHTEFIKRGDFEDIAICNDLTILLRSDGTFFTFPFSEIGTAKTDNVTENKRLLPLGEYESLYADVAHNQLYLLAKHNGDGKQTKTCYGYIMNLQANGKIKQAGTFTVDVRQIDARINNGDINFRPSALSKNPLTNEWYILSSVNKLLVVADAQWKVKAVYPLNEDEFIQPEGMVFDNQGNLYISNEGDKVSPGNILKFKRMR
jgi:hypothetical protein